jgi:hypothetical protein
MNTNSLKRFAKEARIKLLDQVGRKLEYVRTADNAVLRGKQSEIEQLKRKIAEQGKEQVIETVAYTWFNRLMALRFMDANGYSIPKLVTPLPSMTNPEILQNALAGNIEPELKLDRQRLNDLLDGKTAAADAQTEAYKMLLVASCNQWHAAMPFMFERISDYTELLLPDDLLSDYSIVADIRNGMSDEDCGQEELIGWLYQFYIADKKDDVFVGLKKNIKITAENIPAATQLFTPRWIVRYMVENTLGKIWLTLKPESKLRQHMPYYIEAPEGNAPAPLPEGIKGVTDITFLDPCQGSGHVLVYAFDLFTKIYEEEGYNTSEIPALILEHNLYGIDIDERAAQLAAFALTMKARSYYPRFLRKPVQPHVIALENVNEETIIQSVKLPITVNGSKIADHKKLSLHLLTQADNYGSLIQIAPEEVNAIQIQAGSIWQEQQQKLKEHSEYLSRQYHCVVTNPPYMGGKGMNDLLKQLLSEKYSIGKTDLFSAFILRCQEFICSDGYSGMVTMESWMFLSSYEDLRKFISDNTSLQSLSHFGWHVMRIAFGTCSFILQKSIPKENRGVYSFTEIDNIDRVIEIPTVFPITNNGRYNVIHQKEFEKIPGSPIAYWLSKSLIEIFKNAKTLNDIAPVRKGIDTGKNETFLRQWQEVSYNRLSLLSHSKKWFFYVKGGEARKWYGNLNLVVNWLNNGELIRNHPSSTIRNQAYFLKPAITWSLTGSKGFAARSIPPNCMFDNNGSSVFPDENQISLLISFLNSIVANKFLEVLNPTIAFQVGDIARLPILEGQIDFKYADDCIQISKEDWDLRETSWNFQFNNLIIQKNNKLYNAFDKYCKYWVDKFNILHRNEEVLNKQLIEVYGLQSELSHNISLEDISILQEERKIINNELFIDPVPVLLQLMSYSIGCAFGRFCLDKPGLILANQGETLQDFLQHVPNPTFMPDEDNVIPVLEGEWFTDDIVGRFKVFLNAAFGEEHFEENLKYIEDTIGKDIRKYFVKDFYNDHIKRYKTRPIYWMFSSPKGHFKALIYLHRYQPDLCSKMLNDYLQAFISKLEAAKQTQTMLSLREDISAREKTAAIKEIDKLELMLKDCREYEKTLFTIATQKISIDLDDGVKVNYQKFKEVLVPIKGLEKEED